MPAERKALPCAQEGKGTGARRQGASAEGVGRWLGVRGAGHRPGGKLNCT